MNTIHCWPDAYGWNGYIGGLLYHQKNKEDLLKVAESQWPMLEFKLSQ